jgi:endo-1,4-beta-xylanase
VFHCRAFLLLMLAAVAAVWAQTSATPHPVVMLWSGGAPGSEGKTGDETVRMQQDDQIVSSVHHPSITVYLPPKGKATGAAVVVVPGGGHREIWITHEGYRVAEWLSQHGMAAFVLKYRLAREAGSSYSILGHSLPDIQRAIRTVRARSEQWGVDPNRVGVMGFSAGAELAGLAATHFDDPVEHPAGDVDRQSARPAFQALIYPPGASDAKYSKDTPPAFLACGGDDQIAAALPDVYKALKGAGVPAELHIYAGVGHGFGIRETNPPGVAGWIDRFRDWMFDRGLLTGK